ncbi:MAG: sugar ABC transporter permease [Clostridia bacterium]|nr:sugar ABC transporter permease [Clostridia bacterium]MBQ4099473.1 sugar ABC transporter permease [Clostridia bacterium]
MKGVFSKYYTPEGKFSFKILVKKNWVAWTYCIPVVLGILIFTIMPVVTSLVYAFHDYDPTIPADLGNQLSNAGFQHFIKIFTWGKGGLLTDVLWSLFITFRYVIISLTLQIVGSYCVALFLNQQTKGIQAFRIVYYLPNLIPAVAGTLLWKEMMATDGYFNIILESVGLPAFDFYRNKATAMPTLIFTGIFSWGGTAVMWLAQMQNVPKEMYESANLDGANYFHKTFKITIPMTTSMLFYIVVTSIIGGIQSFSNVYPLLELSEEFRFIVVMIYQYAFEPDVRNSLSMACALSWVLFVIIAILTATIFKTSKWVYYGEEV